MLCISELDYEEEQSSELETLRCIYTDEELTGTHCVARLHTVLLLSSSTMFVSLYRSIGGPYLLPNQYIQQ